MVVQEQTDTISMYDDGVLSYAAVVAETTTGAVDEVALATGLPEGQVAARLTLALDEEGRATPLLEALARGEVGLERSLRILQATAALDPDVCRAVTTRLIAPMADGSVRSHRSFVRELRRQVAVHTPDPADARAEALRRRCAYGWLEPDGTGRLTVTGEAGRVTAALDRVDGLARGLRSGGDARTLEQLRSDLTLDLLLVRLGLARPGARGGPGHLRRRGARGPGQPRRRADHDARAGRPARGDPWSRVRAGGGRPKHRHGDRLGLAAAGHRPAGRDGAGAVDDALPPDSAHGPAGGSARRHLPGPRLHGSSAPLRPRPRGPVADRYHHGPQPPVEAPTPSQPQDARHVEGPARPRTAPPDGPPSPVATTSATGSATTTRSAARSPRSTASHHRSSATRARF